jgi:23S rRNA pseudouridine2605 synthase
LSAPIRLNRFLASAGIASRRRCDELIRQGRITVNGDIVTELGTRIAPSSDRVTLDGQDVHIAPGEVTLILHKPKNVLVAARDSRGRKTVMDLLGESGGRVFPVGRLDYRSEGLLVFTNDGELAFRLAHPRFKVEKIYRVEIDGSISPTTLDALRRGVLLEDGMTQPAEVRVLSREKGRTVLEFGLREGRKRQIRRMLAQFGHPVERLVRTRFGPLALDDLACGAWRELLQPEIERLRAAAGMDSPSSAGGAA